MIGKVVGCTGRVASVVKKAGGATFRGGISVGKSMAKVVTVPTALMLAMVGKSLKSENRRQMDNLSKDSLKANGITEWERRYFPQTRMSNEDSPCSLLSPGISNKNSSHLNKVEEEDVVDKASNKDSLDVNATGVKEAVDKILNGISKPTGLILASRDALGEGPFIDGLRELEPDIAKVLNCPTLNAADLENYASGKLEEQADVDAIRVVLTNPTPEEIDDICKIANNVIPGAGDKLRSAGLKPVMRNVSVALLNKELNFKTPFNEDKNGFMLNGKRYASFFMDTSNSAQLEQVQFQDMEYNVATKIKTSKPGEEVIFVPLWAENREMPIDDLYRSLNSKWQKASDEDSLTVPNIDFERTVRANEAFGKNTVAFQVEQFKLDQNGAIIKNVAAMFTSRGLTPKTFKVDYTRKDFAVLLCKDGECIYGLKCIGDDDKALIYKERAF